eukprot:6174474-Pleurochrysis_carterae.AAC.1
MPWGELLQGVQITDWELFLAYTPGFGSNFSTPAMRFTLAVGQEVECAPPLLVADKELAQQVSPPKAPTMGLVLGLLVGEEHWNSRSKVGGEPKPKSETRRFA